MTSRWQKALLWILVLGSVYMAASLIRMRERAQDQLAAIPKDLPLPAPVSAPATDVTLMLANDADGSLSPVAVRLSLPAEQTTRARTLLNDLVRQYSQPGSQHPLAPASAVSDVFLLPLPQPPDSTPATQPENGRLAVVNLTGAFCDHHPSGILVETLTLLSMLGTLHANLPQVDQVRFLVDGQPRETLAGHADLTRTYLTANDVPLTSPSTQPPAATEPAP
jgi:hypothetical protein